MNKVRIFFILLGILFFSNPLSALNINQRDEILFAGTVLSYTARNMPPGHLAYEQFVLLSRVNGQYDENSKLKKNRNDHKYEVLPYIKFGINQILDVNLITSVTHSHSKTGNSTSFGDTLILLGIQLMRAQKNTWVPDMRVLIGESFPTGKYDRLNPKMNGSDVTGSGSFETTFILSMAQVFPINSDHAFRFNPNLYYIIPSSVDISDISIYGSGLGTKGTVKPGQQIAVDFPFEYNITHHFILGMDIFYFYKNRAAFNPQKIGTPFAGFPSSENFSLAPCLEYNPSERFGVESCVWFSVSGRNSLAFTTCVVVAWWYF